MPILHSQITGLGQTPDGKQISLPPAVVMQQRGPLVQVSITLAQSFTATLMQAGKQLPPPSTGFALIDTGASNTCIDDEAAKAMNLPVIDVGAMHSASHARTPSGTDPDHWIPDPIPVAAHDGSRPQRTRTTDAVGSRPPPAVHSVLQRPHWTDYSFHVGPLRDRELAHYPTSPSTPRSSRRFDHAQAYLYVVAR